ncbi:MAG: hypothetical protein P1U42_01565 [Phycisphaerales bacterium]|nr:hypothetical protein [Phycisphaerales bacterium]
MANPKLHQVRVVRYASDGGYAAREWLNAFESIEFPTTMNDGDAFRMGVQITKKRAIDVILRIESIDTLRLKLRCRIGKSVSDFLFKHPKACRKSIVGVDRPLAVLGAKHMGNQIRILVCQPTRDV